MFLFILGVFVSNSENQQYIADKSILTQLCLGLKRSGMKLSLVVGIIVVRYIALPILGVGIVKGAIHFGLIHHDPLYQFILLLQYALPPAISISKLTMMIARIHRFICYINSLTSAPILLYYK